MEVGCDMFTAISELDNILKVENQVAHDLRDYVEKEKLRLDFLKILAKEFETHSRSALENPESHLSNPVNAFLLIKRFTTDWENVLNEKIKDSPMEEFLKKLSNKTSSFPSQEDLNGAVNALLRLQDTYDLPSKYLAEGRLPGQSESPKLTVEDCRLLGISSYSKADYYHAVLWFSEALRLLEDERSSLSSPSPSSSSQLILHQLEAELLDYLSFSYYKQGNLKNALRTAKEYHKLNSDNIRMNGNLKFYQEQLEADPSQMDESIDRNPRRASDYKVSEEFDNYQRLCRGEKTIEVPYKDHFTCQYKRHHPILFIKPAREEIMSLDPPMFVYHGLIPLSQMEGIKKVGRPKLDRSVVFQKVEDTDYTPQDYRISKTGWVKDIEDINVRKFSKRASAISNLTLDYAEELQVLNYGIGGHYEPHYDFSTGREPSEYEKVRGNRIATFICYLSEIYAGGGTVFPSLGIRFTPIKGNCALWYNLMKSGNGDMRTRHAACPVLSGIKWASNKWFRERGQEFIRPCTLSPME